MKNTITIFLGLVLSFCLGYYLKNITHKQAEVNTIPQSEVKISDKKVTGVGGIFFKCKDPKKVKEWYKTHLGFDADDYGARFEYLDVNDTSKRNSLQWSTFSEKTKYFDPSTKGFMINYCVSNLTTLVEQLKNENVTILDTIETYDYGKFIHIMDIEENKIELWEPNYNFK